MRGYMKNFVQLVMLIVFVCIFSTSANARSMVEERTMCIALSALARSQCKDPASFSYVGKQGESVYIYNAFYGSKYTDFFCKVGEGEVKILSRKRKFRRSIKYYIDDNQCGVIAYSPASCSDRHVLRCCFPKSDKEIKADKEAEFWQKPIPDLLQEDQEKALKALQNRTVKSSETKPE
ncbi:hypothetical protein [Maridesulfovibrio ferrireducens]|uniref:hypothetical protein n=1 Tax=Maridesulfovibrio ferrireducens TaxID=246191 RepID=UPI0026EC98A8|nr:hypothetical protein [Maridesulfovibrio ferrireducens]